MPAGGTLAEMEKKVLLVDMDQQGPLSSSFLPNIHDLPVVVTDALLDKRISLKDAVVRTAFENIDLVCDTGKNYEISYFRFIWADWKCSA